MNHDQSHTLFQQARQLMPGGVNSPVRAFKSVGGEPFFAKRAEGAYLIDVDGNRYIDYIGSWGPMIAGHAHPAVIAAVDKVMRDGLSFGVPNALEVTMAQAISNARFRIGIDTGGTFTDIVSVDTASGAVAVTKVPSTPANPGIA
ncbi:MAG: aminotransferase class III-fold pyridoxal phosphate-dependent enzyme, partial [Gammaproteobacteria bacterium]